MHLVVIKRTGEEGEAVPSVGTVWRACHCMKPKDEFMAAYKLRKKKAYLICEQPTNGCAFPGTKIYGHNHYMSGK
jgi:hypothetical protein